MIKSKIKIAAASNSTVIGVQTGPTLDDVRQAVRKELTDPFLLSVLSDLAANAFVEAAEKGALHFKEKEQKQIEKLVGAVQCLRSSEQHFEIGLSEAFRLLAPIQELNRFHYLFSDLAFRQTIMRWMFALSENERKIPADELKALASSMLGTEWGEKAVDVITRSFVTVVQSNSIISGLLNRADHERLLEAAREIAHKVDLRFADSSEQLARMLEEITRLREVPTGIIVEPTVAQYREEIGRYTDNTLRDLRLDLPIIGSIDRIELSQALGLALQEQAILLLGEAGTGKTGVMARLARELRTRNECVLFVPADGIARQFTGSCTIGDLSNALGFDHALPDILGAIAEADGRVWLLVDQLDTVASEPVGGAFVQLIKRMRGRKGCIIVAACRSYEAEFSADVSTIKLPTLHVAELPPEEVCRCLEIFKLAPTADLVGFCGNLLNLSLLATLVQESASLDELTVEAQLWRALREHLGKNRRGSLLSFACDCAIWSARSPSGDFPTEAVSNADQLASFGVLTRMSSGRYRFRHERLRNYFVAYDCVMRRQESVPSLLTRVPVARSKTIVPWMVQIADYESPRYLERLFTETFDSNLVPSTFPRQALIRSLPLILKPTSSLVLAIWRIAVEHDDGSWRHKNIYSEIPKQRQWAEAFWDAKIFDLASLIHPNAIGYHAAKAVLELLPLVSQTYSEQVFAWISSLQAAPPDLTGICSMLFKAPSAQFNAGMNKVLSWWEQSNDEISLGHLDEVNLPHNQTLVRGLFDLVERLEEIGEHKMAIRLVKLATTPFLRSWDRSSSPEDCFLSARYRDTFMPPDEDDEECHFAKKFRLPPADLVGIFRNHIQSIKGIAKEHSFTGWGNPYASWAKVRHLYAPGRKDRHEEWQIWYGALLAVARATLKFDKRAGLDCVRNLLASSDLLEIRIGLYLLAGFQRVPSNLFAMALNRSHFREPAAIGETLLIFDRFRSRKNHSGAILLASELLVAIRSLDRNRPDNLSLDPRLPDSLLRWSETVVLNGAQPIPDESFIGVARFILTLADHYRIRSWSFNKLARFCEICTDSDIKPTGHTFILDSKQTELFDCTQEWNSLHQAAQNVVFHAIDSRFEPLLVEALAQRTKWSVRPIGYAMLWAAQSWLRDYAKNLYEKDSEGASWKPKRRPSETKLRAIISDVLRVYRDVPDLEGGISQALRAQYIGFLSLLSDKIPNRIVREVMPNLHQVIRRLIACKEAGCVQSYGRVFHDSLQPTPMSTAGVALFRLITLLWREQYGNKAAMEIQLDKLKSNEREKIEKVKALASEDHQALVAAIERIDTGNFEIARVFGFCFPELSLLDSSVANEVIQAVVSQHSRIVHTFADGLSRDSSAWLLYGNLRPLYERVIRDENSNIPDNLVHHIACAYLVGWEELQGENSLLGYIRTVCKDVDKGGISEIICDEYDSLGRDARIWPRVRALWQLASDEAGSATTRELAAFWRCLQQGRKVIGNDKVVVKLHVPETIETLAPLLEKTCSALAFDASYSTDKREAVARYLGAQSIGHEAITVRLLGLCLGVHTTNYSYIVVDYHEEAREVLRNAISAGGEARKLAAEIIERHEVESDKSLAGLLL